MGAIQIGTCHICGAVGKLSFEHVPPESAFNDHRVLRTTFDAVAGLIDSSRARGKIQQRGAGGYTLCERCNNKTGSWYAPAFADWARQAMRIVVATRGAPTLFYRYNLYPLRVLKQILCMFFSVNTPRFHTVNRDLVQFILDKNSRELPGRVRVYAFYTFSNLIRVAPIAGLLRGFGTSRAETHVFSEVTFPPFGFILTMNSTPPRRDLLDITSFSKIGYQDVRYGIALRMPRLPIHTGFPGDYRTFGETMRDFHENLRQEQIYRERSLRC